MRAAFIVLAALLAPSDGPRLAPAAAAGQAEQQDGEAPLPPGFRRIPRGNGDDEAPGRNGGVPSSSASYSGTSTTTVEVFDIGAGAKGRITQSVPVIVNIDPPMEGAHGGGSESNPFHLQITSGSLAGAAPPEMEAPPQQMPPVGGPAPGTAPTMSAAPGALYLESATASADTGVHRQPTGTSTVHHYWTLQVSPDGAVSGRLTSQLTTNTGNMVVSAERGGPMSMPPHEVWEPCAAGMHRGTTLSGRIGEDALVLEIQGMAGGYGIGPTCMTAVAFTARIEARRAR